MMALTVMTVANLLLKTGRRISLSESLEEAPLRYSNSLQLISTKKEEKNLHL